jgi:hypothetical protein
LFFYKLQRLLPLYYIDGTRFAPETNTIALLRNEEHFWPESCADKLAVGRIGDGLEHLRDGSTVLGVEIGVDLVKEIEWSGITGLDGEDESERAKT